MSEKSIHRILDIVAIVFFLIITVLVFFSLRTAFIGLGLFFVYLGLVIILRRQTSNRYPKGAVIQEIKALHPVLLGGLPTFLKQKGFKAQIIGVAMALIGVLIIVEFLKL